MSEQDPVADTTSASQQMAGQITNLEAEIDRLRAIRDQTMQQLLDAGELSAMRSMIRMFIQDNYVMELNQAQHSGRTTADVAVHYMGLERRSLRTRFLHMFGKGAW